MEQYYHAPGKLSTMVLEVGARALTKHALNVHCGHDDFYAALDTGWTMLMSKDAQQAADQAIILRRVNELSLNPGMNIQDGMLTTHSASACTSRPEAELLREYLGGPDDLIDCPTPAQRELFGPTRRRVPQMMDLRHPVLLGPVQNQEHHMNGVVARRNNFNEHILPMLEEACAEFGRLTGRHYGLLHGIQDRRRRHRLRLARLRRRQHRGRLRLPARPAQREGRLHPRQRHPPLPRGRRHQRAARQEERHHPRAHRRRPRR
jgi:pyruvate-ferredoxin/flavodoxin oxidoreductase